MSTKNFSIIIHGTTIRGDISLECDNLNVICLHGGGKRGRVGFNKIRTALSSKGISSLAFDYKGHGETGGELSNTSLEDKVKQTIAVINSEKIKKPLTIIASSMGGYVAIKMTELYDVKNLILIAPAIYSKEAYQVPFGSQFSLIIRKPFSWLNSDAWEILKKYSGNIIIYKAENDQIIPEDVIKKIYDSTVNAKKREIITIKKATHPLTDWFDEHSDDLDLAIETMSKLILKSK